MDSSKRTIKYAIGYSLLHVLLHAVGIGLGIYILFFLIKDWNNLNQGDFFMIVLAAVLIFYNGKKMLKEIVNWGSQIIFSPQGIEFKNQFYAWTAVSKPKIVVKKEYVGKSNTEVDENWLQFQSGGNTVEIYIDAYRTTPKEIENLISQYYSPSTKNKTSNKFLKNIPTMDDWYEADTKEADKLSAKTLNWAKTNKEVLKANIGENIYEEKDKIEFIYWTLSDESEWDDFLADEFISIFELAEKDNTFPELAPLLEAIMPNDEDHKFSNKAVPFLTPKLNTNNKQILLSALEHLQEWIEAEYFLTHPDVKNQITELQNHPDWEIRIRAGRLLKINNQIYNVRPADLIREKIGRTFRLFK